MSAVEFDITVTANSCHLVTPIELKTCTGAARAGSSTYRVKILGRRRAQYDRGIGRRDRSKMARSMLARERRGGMMAGDRFNFPHMFFLSKPVTLKTTGSRGPTSIARARAGWSSSSWPASRPDEIRSRRRAEAARSGHPARRALPCKAWAAIAWRSPTAASSASWNCPAFQSRPKS